MVHHTVLAFIFSPVWSFLPPCILRQHFSPCISGKFYCCAFFNIHAQIYHCAQLDMIVLNTVVCSDASNTIISTIRALSIGTGRSHYPCQFYRVMHIAQLNMIDILFNPGHHLDNRPENGTDYNPWIQPSSHTPDSLFLMTLLQCMIHLHENHRNNRYHHNHHPVNGSDYNPQIRQSNHHTQGIICLIHSYFGR